MCNGSSYFIFSAFSFSAFSVSLSPLAAYNAGIGTVDIWIEKGVIKKDGSDIENIPYKETNNYVRKIVRDYKIYQRLYK